MIQKAIDILRMRWPEVMLVVVLQAAMLMLTDEVVTMSEDVQTRGSTLPFGMSFLLGIGVMLFAIIWQMIYLGFLKTAAVSGEHPQQPMELLRAGRPYFWRILFFQVMLGFALTLLNAVLTSLLGKLIWGERAFVDLPEWFVQVCALAGILVALKPLLLVPALVVVYDDTVLGAMGRMRQCRLGRIGCFFAAVIISFVVITVLTVLMSLPEPKSTVYYIISGLHHVVFSLILLWLTLVVVLQTQRQYDMDYPRTNEDER
ncbi:MAG: hypothetical protein ACYSO4_10355 [Planctomycetota bacterium]